jgi:hypothetical protein
MPTWRRIWIAQLLISPHAFSKIGLKHGINSDEIKKYVEGNARLLAIERFDINHGTRTYLIIPYSRKFDLEIFIQLEDLYFSTWSLRTAKPIPTRKIRK